MTLDDYYRIIRAEFPNAILDIGEIRATYRTGYRIDEAIRIIQWELEQGKIAKSISASQLSHHLGED